MIHNNQVPGMLFRVTDQVLLTKVGLQRRGDLLNAVETPPMT